MLYDNQDTLRIPLILSDFSRADTVVRQAEADKRVDNRIVGRSARPPQLEILPSVRQML